MRNSVVRWMGNQQVHREKASFQVALRLIDRVERRDLYAKVFETLFRNQAAENQKIDEDRVTCNAKIEFQSIEN